MAKGVAVRFKSYGETIPKLLKLIKFDEELKKHNKIVLKPNLSFSEKENNTKPEFVEEVLRFCIENKDPEAEVFIVEGSDGANTLDVFDYLGYKKLSEKYRVGFIDLNYTDTEEIRSKGFLKFESIFYPKILSESFIISLPSLTDNKETDIYASLHNMLGCFPAKHYKGFFSKTKNKLDIYPLHYRIHDIVNCKMPDFALIDASNKNLIFAGQPLEMDKQVAKLLGFDWRHIEHLSLIEDSLSKDKSEEKISIGEPVESS